MFLLCCIYTDGSRSEQDISQKGHGGPLGFFQGFMASRSAFEHLGVRGLIPGEPA